MEWNLTRLPLYYHYNYCCCFSSYSCCFCYCCCCLSVFHTSVIFQLILSDRKSPQVSRTLRSNLAGLNSARLPISNASSPFIKLFGGSFRAHQQLQLASLALSCSIVCLRSLARSKYLSLIFVFFDFYSAVRWDSKVDYSAGSLLFFLFSFLFFFFFFVKHY